MIGNTAEYLQANNLILQIMEMIQGKSIFDELKPCEPSDIVNLSLDILKSLMEIHCLEDSEESQSKMRTCLKFPSLQIALLISLTFPLIVRGVIIKI